MFTELTQLLDSSLKMGIPGYDCVAYHNGECVYRHWNGVASLEENTPITGNELYNIYSCSKLITCVAALQLYEKGLFSLEDELSKYMPEYANMSVKEEDGSIRPAKSPILIKHLFEMTAGFNYSINCNSVLKAKEDTNGKCPTREVIRYLANEPLDFDPGTKWQYSLCHDVLAAFVEVISGERFGEYVKKNIFIPLDMKRSTFGLDYNLDDVAEQYRYMPAENETLDNLDPLAKENIGKGEYVNCGKKIVTYRVGDDYESGGAGCVSTVEDYIKFLEAIRIGDILLKKDTTSLLMTNRLNEEQLKPFWHREEGYGFSLGTRCPFDDNSGVTDYGWGGAAGAHYLIDPVNNITLYYSQHVLSSPNSDVRYALTKTATDAIIK